ncbi:hypothetical protein A2V49_02675 [candidate division WWE3 bacterium RBG_19FT_COMBO_34_6]|uniref:Metallo-beta-lactamase domain-containing protein n=1 Tax=candidate division WWE3 bacterium RBG_19FT_COMBO_34_6 TaxID=1802612 RepID=A0A1F4UKP9_UNCKA|nr:MAG: hypothetical protein A2V49_02675 [candidate division WWE3 bacterium RBG_19FT_COMBO_34_6]
MIVLTHFHADHIVGLNRVLKHCVVGSVYYPKSYVDQQSMQNILWFENIKNIKSTEVLSDIVLNLNDLKMVLIPSSILGNSLNNSSFAVYLDLKKFKALLMADLEKAALEKIKDRIFYYLGNQRVEIYKASHHGSLNGHLVHFLSKIRPRICVISVGKKNKFGHPNQKVIEDLVNIGCKVAQTAKEGTIEVLIK